MKELTATLIAITLLTGFITNAADENTRRARNRTDLDQRAQVINRLDDQKTAYHAGLSAVSQETSVPVATLERQRKEHQRVGLGGLFLANEIATHTQKSADQLIKQRLDGKTWNEIAAENNQNLATIESKLTRVEDAMRNAAQGRTATEPARDRVRAADREATRNARFELDRQVREINGLDDNKESLNAGLSVVSKETATPVANIQQLQTDYPNAGLGDVFIATEIASHTQKPAADFIKQHASGKSWKDIATENNQDVAMIQSKLSRLENTMKEAR